MGGLDKVPSIVRLHRRTLCSQTKAAVDVELLVDAALKRVHDFGWTQEAIVQGAKDLDISPAAHGLLSGGAVELVHRFVGRCNRSTAEQLREDLDKEDADARAKQSTATFLSSGVMNRLNRLSPYRENWYQAIALQTLPRNASKSLELSLNMADELWYLGGDRSVDERWYAKRLALVGVMNTAELAWLRDSSKDQIGTAEYVERATEAIIKSGNQIEEFVFRGQALGYMAMNTASSLFRSFRDGY